MIGLADLVPRDATSWEEADRRLVVPQLATYNIAADCLRGRPGDTAVIAVEGDDVRRVTFGQLDELSNRIAAGLVGLGLRPGQRVVVKLAQSVEMAATVLAVLRAGGVAVPVSNVLGVDAVRHRLHDSRPVIVVAGGSEVEQSLAKDAGATLVSTTEGGPGRRLSDLAAAASAPGRTMAATAPDTPGLLMYTSGTTGKSKGVLHGHRVLLGHHGVDHALDHVRPDDVSYSPVDWAWAGGLMLGLLVPLAHGIPVVAHREAHFDVPRVLELMGECGVSVGLFPPTALRLLRQSGSVDRRAAAGLRLRCLVTGAEAVEPDLFGWAATDLGAVVNNAYGQTEANALVGHSSVLGPMEPEALGRPYPGHVIGVLDEQLAPVEAGRHGQLAVRADDPVCMLRYWEAEQATSEKIVDGWLLTGDTVHADPGGQLYFHGRSDDIIKSGGYRLGPAEVEAAIMADPRVAECAVVGLPDPMRGQAVTAFVRLRPGSDPAEELTRSLQQHVRSTVGPHANPRALHFVEDLPRTSTGKVDRAALRRQHQPVTPVPDAGAAE